MIARDEPEARVATLLREAEHAHGEYETTALGGNRDDDWPRWYAAYLLDHGLSSILPGTIDMEVDDLASSLARYAADYERENPNWPWPEAYAQRLVAAFG